MPLDQVPSIIDLSGPEPPLPPPTTGRAPQPRSRAVSLASSRASSAALRTRRPLASEGSQPRSSRRRREDQEPVASSSRASSADGDNASREERAIKRRRVEARPSAQWSAATEPELSADEEELDELADDVDEEVDQLAGDDGEDMDPLQLLPTPKLPRPTDAPAGTDAASIPHAATPDATSAPDPPKASTSSVASITSIATAPAPTPPPPTQPQAEPLSAYTCPICFCAPTRATLTPCGHVCCGECLFTAVKTALRRSAFAHDPGALTAKCVISPSYHGCVVVLMWMLCYRCPVCRATLPGWDGKGGGVIGLQPRVITSVS